MDPLSVVASVTGVLDVSNKVFRHVTDLGDDSEEFTKCAAEIAELYALLLNLSSRLQEESPKTPWFDAIRTLTVENGPFDQFKRGIELAEEERLKGGPIKEEIASILPPVEHLKSLVEIAMKMDHS
jgi:hypothetical protein